MKFVIRRLIAGVILTPMVALAYTAIYAYLVLIGGTPTSSVGEVITTGLVIGLVLATLLQIPTLVKKIF